MLLNPVQTLILSAVGTGYGVVACDRRVGKSTVLLHIARGIFAKNAETNLQPKVLLIIGVSPKKEYEDVNVRRWIEEAKGKFELTKQRAGCDIDASKFDLVLIDEVFVMALDHRKWLKELCSRAKKIVSIGTPIGESNVGVKVSLHDEMHALGEFLGIPGVFIHSTSFVTKVCVDSAMPFE